jgi:hypothetical protein
MLELIYNNLTHRELCYFDRLNYEDVLYIYARTRYLMIVFCKQSETYYIILRKTHPKYPLHDRNVVLATGVQILHLKDVETLIKTYLKNEND